MTVQSIAIEHGEALRLLHSCPYLRESRSTQPAISKTFRGNGLEVPRNVTFTVYRPNGSNQCKVVPSAMEAWAELTGGTLGTLPEYYVDVDDSGWGCSLGGICIGARSTLGTMQMSYIPTKVFLRPVEEYMDRIAEETRVLCLSVFQTDQKPPSHIRMCTAPCFIKARELMSSLGIKVSVGEIRGDLQEKLLDEFRRNLVLLGVPQDMVTQSYQSIILWAKEMGFTEVKWPLAKEGGR